MHCSPKVDGTWSPEGGPPGGRRSGPLTLPHFDAVLEFGFVEPQTFHFGARTPHLYRVVVGRCHQHLRVFRVERDTVHHVLVGKLGHAGAVVAVPQVPVFVFGAAEQEKEHSKFKIFTSVQPNWIEKEKYMLSQHLWVEKIKGHSYFRITLKSNLLLTLLI